MNYFNPLQTRKLEEPITKAKANIFEFEKEKINIKSSIATDNVTDYTENPNSNL